MAAAPAAPPKSSRSTDAFTFAPLPQSGRSGEIPPRDDLTNRPFFYLGKTGIPLSGPNGGFEKPVMDPAVLAHISISWGCGTRERNKPEGFTDCKPEVAAQQRPPVGDQWGQAHPGGVPDEAHQGDNSGSPNFFMNKTPQPLARSWAPLWHPSSGCADFL